MFAYLPHTDSEIREMLADIGVARIDDLFADIPEKIRFKGQLDFETGKSELEVYRRLHGLAVKNNEAVSF